MNKFKIITGILLVFLLGGLAGSLGTSIYMGKRFRTMMQGPPDFLIPKFIRKLERELELSPQQQVQLRRISAELREELDEFMEKNRPQAEEILDRHINSIKSVLKPDQQEKMEKIREKMKHRMMRHGHGRNRRMGNLEPVLSRLRERLGLSEEQMRQIRPHIRESIRKQRNMCPGGNSLTEDTLIADPEMQKHLEKILTPEQMRLLREDT
ncbi:MAG: hypothetical protein R2941_16820 [Desulfobacterales bacterium]